MKETGPETKPAPYFEDASLAAFDPGNSIYNKQINKTNKYNLFLGIM